MQSDANSLMSFALIQQINLLVKDFSDKKTR